MTITTLETPCREFQGPRQSKGYGIRNKTLVHRWVWEQINGPIPAGMQVLHRCDNPPCFRYDHLFLGTPAENMDDKVAKGRARGGSMPGTAHPRASATADQVEVIRTSDASAASLARSLGISTSTVKRIRRGESYR
jgi:hypothetical protein